MLVHECLYAFLAWQVYKLQKKMIVTHPCLIIYANSPTSTNHDDNAAKWMHQPLNMILFSRQAALVLHDTFVVKASIAFRCYKHYRLSIFALKVLCSLIVVVKQQQNNFVIISLVDTCNAWIISEVEWSKGFCQKEKEYAGFGLRNCTLWWKFTTHFCSFINMDLDL